MATARILVGYDGSPHAEDALALARVISSATDAEIVIGRSLFWEPLPLTAVPTAELGKVFMEQRHVALEELEAVADRNGVTADIAAATSVAHGLHTLVEELDPELVVVGSSHRGRLDQVLAGNVALCLLNGLDRPLAIAPAGYAARDARLRMIGVGFDGSPESRAALQAAGRLASASGAEVEVIGAALPHADLAPNPWAFAWGAGDTRDDLDDRLRTELDSAAAASPTASLPRPSPAWAGPWKSFSTPAVPSTCWCWAPAATAPSAACCSGRSPAGSCARPPAPCL